MLDWLTGDSGPTGNGQEDDVPEFVKESVEADRRREAMIDYQLAARAGEASDRVDSEAAAEALETLAEVAVEHATQGDWND